MPTLKGMIRKLAEHDLDSVVRFFRQIDTPEYRVNFAPHPFNGEEARRICLYEGKDLYVGVFTMQFPPEMVGYGMLRGLDDGFSIPSLGLCILNKAQRVGLGRKLLDRLLNECATRGATKVMLKVKNNNIVARTLYESAGFQFRKHNPETLIGFREIEPGLANRPE